MRSDDLEVGVDYAVKCGNAAWRSVARARVLATGEKMPEMRSSYRGFYPSGRSRRVVRVRLIEGYYEPFGAFGLENIDEGDEGVVVAQHVVCLWSEHEASQRRADGFRVEREQLRSEALALCEGLGARMKAAGIEGGYVRVLAKEEGVVALKLDALRKLADMAGV